MNENETLVTEQVTENVEQTTEQTPKTYTQEEVDAIVGKRIARKEAKIRKEYDRKYGDLEDVLKAGTGKQSVEEVDRLSEIGLDKMTAREKAVFKVLAEHRNRTETGRQLAEFGVTEEVYDSKEFKEFANKFNPSTPIRDIFDIYAKTQPKKEFKTMGSMKNTVSANSEVKDFYSPEEAKKFSRADLDKNPALFAAIEKSMQKWK